MMSVTFEIVAFCRTRGIRCPLKKLMVAEYLQKLNEYTGAGNLYLALRNNNKKISYATVYQSLVWLTNNSFVESTAGTDSAGRENKFRIKK